MTQQEHADGVTEGEPLTHEEQALVNWARESRKNAIRTLQESLRGLVTLSASLTALSVGLAGMLNKTPNSAVQLVGLAAVCFFIALGIALYGSLPHGESPGEWTLGDLEGARRRIEARKAWCLWWCAGFIYGGFILSGLWMIGRFFGG